MKRINKKEIFSLKLILVFMFAALLFYTSCQQNKEEAKSPEEKTTQTETNKPEPPVDTQKVKSEPVKKTENKIPDITGTWTGKFDNNVTVLNITSQDSTSFKGKLTIHYRYAVNQEVKGSFNPDKLTLNMSDQIQERYMGKYSAKLSSDMKKIDGTFTRNIDKKKIKFTLTKK